MGAVGSGTDGGTDAGTITGGATERTQPSKSEAGPEMNMQGKDEEKTETIDCERERRAEVDACEWDGGSSEDLDHSNSVITGGKFSSAGGACTAGTEASESGGAAEQRRVFGHGALNQTHVAHTGMAGGC